MALFRVKFAFAGQKQGWSETWVFPTSNDEITAQTLNATTIFPIAQARAQLLAREYVLDAYAISKIRLNNGSPVTRNVKLWTPDLSPTIQSATNAGEQPRTCIVVQAESPDGGRKKMTFMRGIPDDIAHNGGVYNPSGASGWGSRFASWASVMVQAGAGWLQDVPVGEAVAITTYAVNPNNTVTFTLGADLFAGIPQNSRRMVRVRGVNAGSVLNGAIEVVVVSDNEARTVKSYAVFPYSFGGEMTLYTQPKPFISAGTINPSLIRTRDTGRPSYATRGRQPARARG